MAKQKRYTVGITTGVFDLFHKGHRSFLKQAMRQCDRLIVMVNSEDSVFNLKGKYPVQDGYRRRQAVQDNIRPTDFVIPFTEERALVSYANGWAAEVLFKDSDYKGKSLTINNIPVVYIRRDKRYSTTKLRRGLKRGGWLG